MTPDLHVIFGTGPVGCWTARALRGQGKQVRAVNRNGARPDLMPADVEMVKVDASDPAQAREASKGAGVVYQALNPPYHLWNEFFPGLQAGVLGAAKAENARYVSIENLYMYDSSKPITEDSPIAPVSTKGALRQKMAEEVMALHSRGEVRTVAIRSSDYYGPGVVGSALGEMVFGNLVGGKKRPRSAARRGCCTPLLTSRTLDMRRQSLARTTRRLDRSGSPRTLQRGPRAKWSRRLVEFWAQRPESA
jgi:nucleoside-diphosphate-sugar epimerase